MQNFLTIEIESYMGAAFITMFAAFSIGIIFIAVKNFDSDITIITSGQTQIKTISTTERILIQDWLRESQVEIPEEVGYRYLIKKYPSRPWLN